MSTRARVLATVAAVIMMGVLGGDTLTRPVASNTVAAVDKDGDGIPNKVESDPDYMAKGGSPNHKDLWLECDYMKGRALNWMKVRTYLEAAYAAGPIENPDGETGIAFHLVVGEEFKFEKTWAGDIFTKDAEYVKLWNKTMERRELSFVQDPDVDPSYYHYCIVINKAEPSGGLLGISMDSGNINGGIPGDTTVMSFGGDFDGNRTPERHAGTIMHELGHNIGLRHGGNDHVNNKLNYLSIMNYIYTDGYFKETRPGRASRQKHWDYSTYQSNPLNERKLDESKGVDESDETVEGKFVGIQACPAAGGGLQQFYFLYNEPLDFNCNGELDEGFVKFNVNFDEQNNRDVYSTHGSENNWENIVWDGGAIAGAGASAPSSRPELEGEPNGVVLEQLRRQAARGLRRSLDRSTE